MKKIGLILSSVLLSLCSQATVTLQFSTFTEQAAGFQNGSGSPTDGMPFGIVVDTSGGATGFGALSSLNTFDISTNLAAIAPDLVYDFGGNAAPPTTTTAFGEVGAVTTLTNVQDYSVNDPFAIIWFPDSNADSGSTFGFLTDPGFQIGSPGSTTDYSALGVFSGTGSFEASSNIVPEPSAFALIAGCFGLALAMARRRV